MKRYNFFLDEQQLAAMKAVQARTGETVSEQLRRAVSAYLLALPPEPPVEAPVTECPPTMQ